MFVKQVSTILNTIAGEMLGVENPVNEDLSNVADVGKQIENLDNGFDNYVRKLNNHIGRVTVVERIKPRKFLSVYRDGWEYGSILEKIRFEMPEAEENETWKLVDRASYDTQIFYAPKVHVRLWNGSTTFEVPMSFTVKQIRESFSNATQLNAFYSGIETTIINSINSKMDNLVLRTINNLTAETIYNEFPTADYSAGSGVRAINLLYLYNESLPQGATPLTKEEALYNADFIRFASFKMGVVMDDMDDWSVLYNLGGTEKFTPADRRLFILLSEFKRAAGAYLYSAPNQYRTDDILLPESETVTKWQGSGLANSFESKSSLNVTTSEGHTVNIDGILGVCFDKEAVIVTNLDNRVLTDVNNKAEFWTERHKVDAGYLNDFDENFVVFFIA